MGMCLGGAAVAVEHPDPLHAAVWLGVELLWRRQWGSMQGCLAGGTGGAVRCPREDPQRIQDHLPSGTAQAAGRQEGPPCWQPHQVL